MEIGRTSGRPIRFVAQHSQGHNRDLNRSNHSIGFNSYGESWCLEGDSEEWLGYFRQALELNPGSGLAKRSIAELEAKSSME